jgi:aspartyl protease family protein
MKIFFKTLIYLLLIVITINNLYSQERKFKRIATPIPENPKTLRTATPSAKNIVKWEEESGVKKIYITIEGAEMIAIFDTGSADLAISVTEYDFLVKQNKLTNADDTGEGIYIDAQGHKFKAKMINLKTVKIGNKTIHNVEASVIDNPEADILLGSTVLDKFGTVTIDNINHQLIFE